MWCGLAVKTTWEKGIKRRSSRDDKNGVIKPAPGHEQAGRMGSADRANWICARIFAHESSENRHCVQPGGLNCKTMFDQSMITAWSVYARLVAGVRIPNSQVEDKSKRNFHVENFCRR